MQNKQIMVGGFHRSGTSLLARILHDSGLNMGAKMLGERASNIHGHYEDIDVVRLHNKILSDNKLTWQEDKMRPYKFSEHIIKDAQKYQQKRDDHYTYWGFKDPRFCLFTMLWKMLIPNMKIIITYRHYTDCYLSLNKRHTVELFHSKDDNEKKRHLPLWNTPDLVLKMWIVYNSHLLNFAKKFPNDVIVTSHENIMSGENMVNQINTKWGLELNSVSMDDYIDNSLVSTEKNITIPCSNISLSNQVTDVLSKLQQLQMIR